MLFQAYYHWDVYYETTAGIVLLPQGYAADTRQPVTAYLAANPGRVIQ